jgi:hypothetical protein
VPDQPLYLGDDLALRGPIAENPAGDGNGDDEQRRQREYSVVRERRREAKRVLLRPGGERLTEQRADALDDVEKLLQDPHMSRKGVAGRAARQNQT